MDVIRGLVCNARALEQHALPSPGSIPHARLCALQSRSEYLESVGLAIDPAKLRQPFHPLLPGLLVLAVDVRLFPLFVTGSQSVSEAGMACSCHWAMVQQSAWLRLLTACALRAIPWL